MKLVGIAFTLNKLTLTFCAPSEQLSPHPQFLRVHVCLRAAVPQQLDYWSLEKLVINVTPPGLNVTFITSYLGLRGFWFCTV